MGTGTFFGAYAGGMIGEGNLGGLVQLWVVIWGVGLEEGQGLCVITYASKGVVRLKGANFYLMFKSIYLQQHK